MSLTDKVTGRVKKAAGDLADDASLRQRRAPGRAQGRGEGRARPTPRRRPTARPRKSPTSSARPEPTPKADLKGDCPALGSSGGSGACGGVWGRSRTTRGSSPRGRPSATATWSTRCRPQPPSSGRLGGHLDLRLLAVALVDHLALDDAVGADRERERDRPLGPELDAVGDQLGDDELEIFEHFGREDLVEDLERCPGLGRCVIGGWELEAELHMRVPSGASRAYVPQPGMRHPRSGVGTGNGDH